MRVLKPLATLLLVVFVVAVIAFYEGDIPKDVIDAKYQSPASQFLDLGPHGLIHYRDQGPRRAPVLILTHGFGASLHAFERWVSLLENDFRVITLDLPAHGLTGATPAADYSTVRYVQTIEALATHLALKEFSLGGHSMGGAVAWRYATTHPDRVDALILVNASGPGEWQDVEAARPPLVFKLLQYWWFRSIASRLDPYLLIAEAIDASYHHSPVENDALILRYYHLILRAGSRDAIIRRTTTPDTNAPAADDLARLTLPTLLLWGREDKLVSMAIGQRFNQTLPDSELIIYDDVGHVPMEELPERSADDVRSFLKAVTADAEG